MSPIKKPKHFTSANDYLNIAERERLQNKIMMINTVLAFNLNQTQKGYKPKSKCWTATANQLM
jgi:hypothetical protein